MHLQPCLLSMICLPTQSNFPPIYYFIWGEHLDPVLCFLVKSWIFPLFKNVFEKAPHWPCLFLDPSPSLDLHQGGPLFKIYIYIWKSDLKPCFSISDPPSHPDFFFLIKKRTMILVLCANFLPFCSCPKHNSLCLFVSFRGWGGWKSGHFLSSGHIL